MVQKAVPRRVNRDGNFSNIYKIHDVKPIIRPAYRHRSKPKSEPMVLQAELHNINKEIKALKLRKASIQKKLREIGSGLTKSGYFKKNITLYVLRLENDCWYIGSTRNVQRRFQTHLNGKGSKWTKLHKPIDIVETRETNTNVDAAACRMEDDLTLEYATKYGTHLVRGGGYTQTKPYWPDWLRD